MDIKIYVNDVAEKYMHVEEFKKKTNTAERTHRYMLHSIRSIGLQ